MLTTKLIALTIRAARDTAQFAEASEAMTKSRSQKASESVYDVG